MDNYKLNNLSYFEKDLLINWFLYHMSMEQRYDLMENFPKIYFKMTGVKPKVWDEKEEQTRESITNQFLNT